jgi:hypothetical protein
LAHTHSIEWDDPSDYILIEPGKALALLLACFVLDKESKYSQEDSVHPDVKDEFDELARALEGVKEDLCME